MAASVQQPASASFSGVSDSSRQRASYEARPSSFHGTPSQGQQSALFYNAMSPPQSMQGGPPANGYRSFDSQNLHQGMDMSTQIYTASYSGVAVYEMEINNVAVMRRRSDSWLNATQILKVAGVDKGKRTKVLEKEILTGEHEKVQGGYGKYQGTWISYDRGREFCRQYGVEDLLRPLLDYDVASDGNANQGQNATPTKEQAMAMHRKRLLNAGIDNRQSGPMANGTFFQNLSPTASSALAAVSKARIHSPAPRNEGMQRQPSGPARQHSQQGSLSQESQPYPSNSQRSNTSMISQGSFGGATPVDSGYATQNASTNSGQKYDGAVDIREPPRKKMKPLSQSDLFAQMDGTYHASIPDDARTEPNESFVYQEYDTSRMDTEEDAYATLRPLPEPIDPMSEQKRATLFELFADPARTDFSKHSALAQLSNEDLDIPLDQSANTALHWAATLARVSLLRLLLERGANMRRGNAVGQTPLMSAVQVNNCFDHSCFPEMLEIFAPLIEVRDDQGRTMLHHIAVSCGIKGRAASSKYYLEALLEYLVRSKPNPPLPSQGKVMITARPMNLFTFIHDMVNVQDKAGNTAFNLVARIGNSAIIRQLQEVHADATIPNFKGLRPLDFGVESEVDGTKAVLPPSTTALIEQGAKPTTNRIDEGAQDITNSISALLSQIEAQSTTEMRAKQEQVDRVNSTIRELSAEQRAEVVKLERLQQRFRAKADRQRKLANIQHSIQQQRTRLAALSSSKSSSGQSQALHIDATQLPASSSDSNADSLTDAQRQYLDSLPSAQTMRAQLQAIQTNSQDLAAQSAALRAKNGELEMLYRKVVSLCTGVDEKNIEHALSSLVAAVESETQEVEDASRVREFLRKIEGVQS